MKIPFGEWLPDLPPFELSEGSPNVRNVVPKGRGFGPFKSISAYSNALTARCQGGIAVKDKNGSVWVFAGDATKLYRQSGATFSDVSRLAGGAYALGSSAHWDFAVYNDNLIATNIADDVQTFALATDSNFSALAGSPPKAAHCAVIREFVVLGNLVGFPNRLHWCASGNSTNWTIGSNESDRQDIYEGGPIRGIVGGEYGVVFQEAGITRMTRIGGGAVFQLDKVESNRGTRSPKSIIPVGSNVFFLDTEGFMMFDGQQSRPIAAEKFSQTVVDDLNPSYYTRVVGASDPRNHYVAWIYVSNSASLVGIPDKMVIFNYATGRGSIVHINLEYILTLISQGTDLDTMAATYPDLDAITDSLDSPIWMGGSVLFGGFDSDHKEGFFTGSNMEAIVETQEVVNDLNRLVIQSVLPLIDTTSLTIAAGYRERLGDTVNYTSEASVEQDGRCSILTSARYHRFRATIAAGASWSHAVGVNVEGADGGYS